MFRYLRMKKKPGTGTTSSAAVKGKPGDPSDLTRQPSEAQEKQVEEEIEEGSGWANPLDLENVR